MFCAAPSGEELPGGRGNDFRPVANNSEICRLEDRCLGIVVDRDDVLGFSGTEVWFGWPDTAIAILEARGDGPACEPDLHLCRAPSIRCHSQRSSQRSVNRFCQSTHRT